MSIKFRVAAAGVAALSLAAPLALAGGAQGAKPATTQPSVSTKLLNCGGGTNTSGAGAAFLSYCVSSEGNVASFRAGVAGESINVGTPVEGYALCYTGGPVAYDIMSSAANWGPPSGTAAAGISRTTLDGKFKLTQVFAKDASGGVRITITLRNNSALVQTGIKFSRVVDFDANNTTTNQAVGGPDSVTALGGTPALGVTLKNLSFPLVHAAGIETFGGVFATPTCAPVAPLASPQAGTDLGARIDYTIGNLNPGISKVIKVLYTRA